MDNDYERPDDLERMLRRCRPEAPGELVDSVGRMVGRSRPRHMVAPIVLAVVLTAAMFVSLTSFGAIGSLSSSVERAASAVTRIGAKHPVRQPARTPAKEQYGQPGTPPKQCKKSQALVGKKCVAKIQTVLVTPRASSVAKQESMVVKFKLGAPAKVAITIVRVKGKVKTTVKTWVSASKLGSGSLSLATILGGTKLQAGSYSLRLTVNGYTKQAAFVLKKK